MLFIPDCQFEFGQPATLLFLQVIEMVEKNNMQPARSLIIEFNCVTKFLNRTTATELFPSLPSWAKFVPVNKLSDIKIYSAYWIEEPPLVLSQFVLMQ